MTFETFETSIQDGAPAELYEFARETIYYRYTSGADDVTVDGVSWTAVLINRSAIENTSSADKSTIKITVARSNPIADLFRISPPSDVVTIKVKRYHRGDNDTRVIWMGRVVNCEWRGAEATLSCEPVTVSMNRVGLRRLYQRSCPHRLYGSKCGISKATYSIPGTVDSISGNTVSVSEADAAADGYYSGGEISWVTPEGVTEMRQITNHTGAVLTLSLAIQGLAAGEAVTISAGCNRSSTTCRTKFNNLPNYGGFPYIPTKNPLDGSLSH